MDNSKACAKVLRFFQMAKFIGMFFHFVLFVVACEGVVPGLFLIEPWLTHGFVLSLPRFVLGLRLLGDGPLVALATEGLVPLSLTR